MNVSRLQPGQDADHLLLTATSGCMQPAIDALTQPEIGLDTKTHQGCSCYNQQGPVRRCTAPTKRGTAMLYQLQRHAQTAPGLQNLHRAGGKAANQMLQHRPLQHITASHHPI
jgi:hypothetical protein